MISSAGLRLAYSYLNSNPEKNIPKLLEWVDRLDKKGHSIDIGRLEYTDVCFDTAS